MPASYAIAWNGISLCSPEDWEPSILERDFMRLEQDGIPVAEIKWRRVGGAFSAYKHMRKLDRKFRSVDIHEGSPSQEWDTAADSLRQSGFNVTLLQWGAAVGAMMHNPATGLALLAQFFEPGRQAAAILASFRDHWNGESLPWRMFGIQARLPSGFLLDTFSFRPGHYTLRFRRPRRMPAVEATPQDFRRGAGTDLILERYAPADAILKNTDFHNWVLERYRKVIVGQVSSKSNMIEWADVQKRFLRSSMRHQGRIWLDQTANSFFSVVVEGEPVFQEEDFKRVCDEYGAV